MGLFLKEFYPSGVIAANDLGAISFYADVDCLDLWGLASREVATCRLAGQYDREEIARLAQMRGCRIALVYEPWFHPGGFAGIGDGKAGGLPEAWLRAGEWTIQETVVAGDTTVSFFAIALEEVGPLREHLREFSPRLPRTVRQGGPYLN